MIEQQKRKVPGGPGPAPAPAPGAAPGAAPGPDLPLVPTAAKRPRHELPGAPGSGGGGQPPPGALLQAGPPRCSSLQAPIMLLSGHEGEVYCCKFHPNGNTLASAGFDRLILLWNVYGDCDNYATLKGHSGAVMELHYNTDGSMLFSASTDKTVAVWDSETGERVKRLKGHTSFVNSCYPARRGPQLVCTGSDDGTVKLWDIRKKAAVQTFQNTYQVLAVTFNDTSDQIISGGIDNDIKVWDLRQNKLTYTMRGHADSVTGLSLSSEGSYLLSNAMDNTVRIWDVRPFAPKERCVKIFQGNVHNFEKNLLRCSWSPDGSKIAGGSADRFVYVWDTTSRRILYKLPGHAGSVNELAFHPEEPIRTLAPSARSLRRSSQKLTQVSPEVKPRAWLCGADGLCSRAVSDGFVPWLFIALSRGWRLR
ncbi:U5 small nuclear ribonucleoprotein 40 kDa protein isoform X1 [Caloenas nicobarica]|uniref:U5 small nuclear ribonucleoprotein 40 kDa protein isoform X1 n=1 Tax=Caloenas nicobarica TaxID=187106 RepID=UPI0032B86194